MRTSPSSTSVVKDIPDRFDGLTSVVYAVLPNFLSGLVCVLTVLAVPVVVVLVVVVTGDFFLGVHRGWEACFRFIHLHFKSRSQAASIAQ